MKERFASIGTLVSLSVLACLLLVHALGIVPGYSAMESAASAAAGWISAHEVKTADYISLIGALGTVGAVVVALRLAGEAQRESKDEKLIRAQLAAAGVAARVTNTLDEVSYGWVRSVFLPFDMPQDYGRITGIARVKAIVQKELFWPDANTLLALTPLPNKCAQRIARAADLVELVRRQAQEIPEAQIEAATTANQREQILANWTRDLGSARDLLQLARAELVSASELGAPMPTREELHGPDVEDEFH